MDLVCVAPNFIERKNHFFDGLYEILKKDPNVTKINKIEISYNPIIKLDYSSTHYFIYFSIRLSSRYKFCIDQQRYYS